MKKLIVLLFLSINIMSYGQTILLPNATHIPIGESYISIDFGNGDFLYCTLQRNEGKYGKAVLGTTFLEKDIDCDVRYFTDDMAMLLNNTENPYYSITFLFSEDEFLKMYVTECASGITFLYQLHRDGKYRITKRFNSLEEIDFLND